MSKFSINKKIWLKNWAGRWSLCFCSFYGYTYTKGLEKIVGQEIKECLLVFEPKISSNYLIKDQVIDIGRHFARLLSSDKTLAKKWCNQVIKETDNVLALVKVLLRKKEIKYVDYIKLRNIIYRHIPPNFAIKKAADFLSPNLLDKYLADFSYVRTYSESVYDDTDRILRKILSQIAKFSGLPEKLLLTLTKTEVENYFKNRSLPTRSILQKRFAGCALVYKHGQERIIEGEEFVNLRKIMVEGINSAEVSGSTAFPGVARGKARIIFDPRRVKVFQTGDILFTGMTRPEFLGLMKKSAAFVTDAGGMLSHAAIVARELKKPCIVGTENATKVFKDGDMVEVDANKGIVKILNKK